MDEKDTQNINCSYVLYSMMIQSFKVKGLNCERKKKFTDPKTTSLFTIRQYSGAEEQCPFKLKRNKSCSFHQTYSSVGTLLHGH